MKVNIHYKVINSDFDQEYANDYHFGKESENNIKYHWAVAYLLENVERIELIENTELSVNAEDKRNGEKISFTVPDVSILRCHLTKEKYENFAVSKTLLERTQQVTKKDGKVHFYFYLHDKMEMVHPFSGLVVEMETFQKNVEKNYSAL